jgi:transcriptional regulator of acetoin/glycerol metabolism
MVKFIPTGAMPTQAGGFATGFASTFNNRGGGRSDALDKLMQELMKAKMQAASQAAIADRFLAAQALNTVGQAAESVRRGHEQREQLTTTQARDYVDKMTKPAIDLLKSNSDKATLLAAKLPSIYIMDAKTGKTLSVRNVLDALAARGYLNRSEADIKNDAQVLANAWEAAKNDKRNKTYIEELSKVFKTNTGQLDDGTILQLLDSMRIVDTFNVQKPKYQGTSIAQPGRNTK